MTVATGPGRPPITTSTSGNDASRSDVPLKEMLVDLWRNTEKLFRQELALATAELDEKARTLKTEVTSAAIGGAVLYAGLLTLAAALVLLLAEAMAPWVAALLVGAALVIGGFVMLRRQPRLGSTDLTPRETMRNIKEDVHTFKEAIK